MFDRMDFNFAGRSIGLYRAEYSTVQRLPDQQTGMQACNHGIYKIKNQ